ncbi:MAG TPA: transglycosylase domain-containing protein, partial [Myxococcota bacterium]|nr:transglycosylase domain-containing protein [Myxococcota bacterium]
MSKIKRKSRSPWRTALGSLILAGGAAGVSSYLYLRAEMPKIRSLADYEPLQSTQVFSDDGHLVGAFHNERRTVVPFSAIPAHVVHAFLAAEDANFYTHEGIDYFGILRAILKNLRPGAHLQGASTITQQTVKTLVLGPERSLSRKAREALLAHELEQVLTKDGILTIYLNQIYFGNGAWGVEEAAQTYFGKSVRSLSLGEGALLAAIPKNPSRYNIKSDPASAKARQRYVLEQMLGKGWADAAAVSAAVAEPVPVPAPPPPYFGKAPHYLEQVRRQLVDAYGEQRLYEAGLTVYTGMSAKQQAAAHTAVRQGIEDVARKQGYAGAPLRIEVDKLERIRQALHKELAEGLKRRETYGLAARPRRGWVWDLTSLSREQLLDETQARRGIELVPLADYQRLRGLVTRLDPLAHEAHVDLGTTVARLPLRNMAWARRFSPRAHTPAPRDPS